MTNKTTTEEGELAAEVEYQRKTQAEIRELALGVRSGTVFGSWMLKGSDQELLPNIFMPLLFMNDIQNKAIERDNIVQFYGYLADAAPRSINGFPMFFSMHMINAEDCRRLSDAMKLLESFMADEEEG